MLPRVKGHQSKSNRVPVWELLKNRELVLLMGLNLVVQITLGFYYSFFSKYYTSDLGASNALLGWGMFLSSISEVPFLLFADRILKKIGVEYTLTSSSLFMALRWLLLHSITNIYVLLFVQVLHGVNFIVFSFSLATYINNKFPKELKASGQAMNGLINLGLSRILGSMLGGVLSDAFGIKNMFLYNSVLAAVTAVVFCVIFIRENLRKNVTASI
jgi:PPP family 3-phenylpropionic acid transporter